MVDTKGQILVVDDNRLNRMRLAHSLEQEGHSPAMAEDGRQALEMLAEDECYGGETDARQVFDRLAGCWAYWMGSRCSSR